MAIASVVVLLIAPLTANIVSPMPAAMEIVMRETGVSNRGSSVCMLAQVSRQSAEAVPQIKTWG